MGLLIYTGFDWRRLQQILDDKFNTYSDGTVSTYPRFLGKVVEGRAFAVSHIFEDVASGASTYIMLENPSGSGVDAYIVAVTVSSLGQAYVRVYREFTVVSQGAAKTPQNLNLGSGNASGLNVYVGGSYDVAGAEPSHESVVPGGGWPRIFGQVAEVGEALLMPPGTSILVEHVNKAGTSVDMSSRIIWWEDPLE